MSPSAQGRRKSVTFVALFLFALFSIFILVFFLTGSNSREAAPGQFLLSDPEEPFTLLALEESPSGVLAILKGEASTLLLRLEPSIGEILEGRELPEAADWAGIRQGTLFLRVKGESNPELISLDLGTLQETSRRILPWQLNDLFLFDCDATNAYCVLSKSRNTLEVFGSAGSFSREFSRDLEFLEAGSSGLCLSDGGTLFQSQSGAWVETAFEHIPLKLLGDAVILCRDGTIFRREETGLAPLFQWEAPLYSGLFYCLDGENCLILSKAESVFCYSQTGKLLSSCVTDPLLGICPSGGITRHDGALYYVPFSFAGGSSSVVSSPEPSPTFAPSNSPDFQQKEPLKIDGSFLLFPVGTTVPELRELFKPDTADIRDAAGRSLLGGRLATGMTVNDWVIVVEGDCNGSGTVTAADLRQALTMVLEQEVPQMAQGKAADLNNDGVLDTTDLLLFSGLIGN